MLSVALVSITALAWVPRLGSTAYHRSVLLSMMGAFQGETAATSTLITSLPPAELVQYYRDLTGSPLPESDTRYWGKARDCDVLLFVLETAPAKCLSLDGDLQDFPTLRRLREQSWVGPLHHTTYPYTSRAIFSILTSWYPSSLMVDFSTRLPKTAFPGMMRTLKHHGYATGSYLPATFMQLDIDPMYASGIDKRFYSSEVTSAVRSADPLRNKIELDRVALEALKGDIRKWHKENRRFAAIFQPQVGHAPWLDATGGAIPSSDRIARGRALIRLQDEWLGDLVHQLEKASRLEKTLIVFTGDHGIRTKQEDPTLQGGMIEDYTFHVPFLLYAPSVLRARQDVSWLTSHIDISPSVLDLLGLSWGRDFEQGSPLWDGRLTRRTTFFWANHYFGTDGYYQPGLPFAMWNHFSDTVYCSDRLNFRTAAAHVRGSPTHAAVTDCISRMVAVQEAWAHLPDRTGRLEPSPKVRSLLGGVTDKD